MLAHMQRLENAARLSLGPEESDPLPPGPTYGPFGYFRLAILVLAAVIAALGALNYFAG
ncbi:MAG: hypothetical protein K5872_22715 [Rhizobiaceae bacterium]|nr:hypothetical protein [Rhizobiaceae bacterium]MCV0409035.1 hypothetical protein [Rhizobiaceae bacterium]